MSDQYKNVIFKSLTWDETLTACSDSIGEQSPAIEYVAPTERWIACDMSLVSQEVEVALDTYCLAVEA